MELSLGVPELAAYTARQLNHLFPDGDDVRPEMLRPFVCEALDRVDYCFKHIAHPVFSEDGRAKLDHLHADQYCAYLYYLSNTIHRLEGDPGISKKLYGLNKALNGFNCLYDTELPDIFRIIHGVGTILGRAQYRNYLVVCHNCTIGAIRGVFPTMGERLILSAGAGIVGECTIGENVTVGPGCMIVKQDVPSNTLVTAVATLEHRPNSDRPIQNYFRI